MNTMTYQLMARVGMRSRVLRMPPEDMMAEAALEPGWRVLDYGCGPGTFTVPAGEAVGAKGEVFALDIQPMALQLTRKRVDRSGLNNVLVLPGCEAGLIKSDSLDMVILFDVYHLLDGSVAYAAAARRTPSEPRFMHIERTHAAGPLEVIQKNQTF